MKHPALVALILTSLAGCSISKKHADSTPYQPDDPALYTTITRLDSAFFAAYNTCDVNLATWGAFFADSVEFYHDKGGVLTSKPAIIEATRRNVCGKVTRELVKGSIEVYPIQGYGAVELGQHRFHNRTEPVGTPSSVGRFVIVWRQRHNRWQITRVISLH
ncbi:MAG: nuclear transport factor 2 family protein [Janthinobacterium lividum]